MASAIKKMAKFCANLSFLFTEKPFLERYELAKKSGFKTVETGFPFGISKDQVVQAKNNAGINQILLNIYTGDTTKGELGFAAIPGKEIEFKESLTKTIDYAKALKVKKIHIMAGKVLEVTHLNDTTYENNLRYAANELAKENILALIEPINPYSVPNYYMNSYEKALKVLTNINNPNLKIMLDLFHLQLIQGNISHTITNLMPHIGHVQIAQVPNRNEPNTSGEINYTYILDNLRKQGYDDFIGLEYKPLDDTQKGLKWISDMGFTL